MRSLKDYIIHNDHHIVVANKPCGLGVSRTRTQSRGFMQIIESFVKQPIFSVHRIDVPVSGVVLFAKTKKAASHLGKQFKEKQVNKTYLAVSRNNDVPPSGEWEDMVIKHLKGNKSSIVTDHDKSKLAKCAYEWIESLEHVHLWKLYPSTGRHHQLRLQMSEHIGPIRGDQKYGDKRGNRDRSIDLHALAIEFTHPSTNKIVKFGAPPPDRSPWNYFKLIEKINAHV